MGGRLRGRTLTASPLRRSRLAAASTVLAPLLGEAGRSARVVGTSATPCTWSRTTRRVPLVCICTPEAVRLPPSLVLPGPLPTHLGRALVGIGGVELGDTWLGVGRWWRPLRLRLEVAAAARRRTQLAWVPTAAGTGRRGALPRSPGGVAGRTTAGPRRGGAGRRGVAVRRPAGDDLLGGVLVTLRALRSTSRRPVGPRRSGQVGRGIRRHTSRPRSSRPPAGASASRARGGLIAGARRPRRRSAPPCGRARSWSVTPPAPLSAHGVLRAVAAASARG